MPVSKNTRKNGKPRKVNKTIVSKHDLARELKDMDLASVKMIEQTAKFAPYLVNKELVAAGDSEQIQNNSSILSRDMIQMKLELNKIRADTPDNLNVKDSEHVMVGLRLGELYSQWHDKYEAVILPTVICLGELFTAAATELEKASNLARDTLANDVTPVTDEDK
jgi:hypothetical protein